MKELIEIVVASASSGIGGYFIFWAIAKWIELFFIRQGDNEKKLDRES